MNQRLVQIWAIVTLCLTCIEHRSSSWWRCARRRTVSFKYSILGSSMLESWHPQTAWINKEFCYILSSNIIEDLDSCNRTVQSCVARGIVLFSMGRTKSEVTGAAPQLGRSIIDHHMSTCQIYIVPRSSLTLTVALWYLLTYGSHLNDLDSRLPALLTSA
jgi:hypothetical protein